MLCGANHVPSRQCCNRVILLTCLSLSHSRSHSLALCLYFCLSMALPPLKPSQPHFFCFLFSHLSLLYPTFSLSQGIMYAQYSLYLSKIPSPLQNKSGSYKWIPDHPGRCFRSRCSFAALLLVRSISWTEIIGSMGLRPRLLLLSQCVFP